MKTPKDSAGFSNVFADLYGDANRVPELEKQVAALTKENDRLRAELVEATARASRLAKLHASRNPA